MSHRLFVIGICSVLFFSAIATQGQDTSSAPPAKVSSITTFARAVVLDVVVTDSHGHPVKGLKAG